jgi:hypothetical protein
MSQRTTLGITGSALLAVGAFLPLVSVPIVGSITYVHNGRGDGIIVLALAVLSALIVLAKRFRVLWLTGLASLALIGYSFLNIRAAIALMEMELANNPFRGLANVQLQWGWAVLIVGAVLLLATAGMRTPSAPAESLPATTQA